MVPELVVEHQQQQLRKSLGGHLEEPSRPPVGTRTAKQAGCLSFMQLFNFEQHPWSKAILQIKNKEYLFPLGVAQHHCCQSIFLVAGASHPNGLRSALVNSLL
ncbi:hypothetical protein H310_14943, partial [Aphanomyces invadans]